MIAFNKYYNHFNILSITLVVVSLLLLSFKGLNFGIDFWENKRRIEKWKK